METESQRAEACKHKRAEQKLQCIRLRCGLRLLAIARRLVSGIENLAAGFGGKIEIGEQCAVPALKQSQIFGRGGHRAEKDAVVGGEVVFDLPDLVCRFR
jgi:hypothetical protein